MNKFNRNEDFFERFISLNGSILVYKTSSSYQNIYVTERSKYEGTQGKFRMLQFSFDGIQGVINLEQPQALAASYSRITVDLINHYASDFNKGFIIGHGIGTVSSYYSHKHMVTAEIDPIVVEVSKTFFGHTGKNVFVGDGQALLNNQEPHSQDLIFLDAYSNSELPSHLTTKEFFTLTNEKLSDPGILIINYIGMIKNDKFLHTLHARISEIFPYLKVFATNSKKKTKQNLFLVASRQFLEDYSPQEATPIQIIGI
ncbi:fused MFS/spermidine synthase [Neobacillus sp. SuZ13]|uniref:spermidine synthase n=1 Tax=Neobacillus sp. SuZ13 TaxID=3047875 RepID=UPI0024BF8883|nr:fused MFS/spermidine synthase [Neobacillus sp. SuZ13]WHY69317.1 fused MFS/spermidine synthase [Neobacillus sp. SuZ13]